MKTITPESANQIINSLAKNGEPVKCPTCCIGFIDRKPILIGKMLQKIREVDELRRLKYYEDLIIKWGRCGLLTDGLQYIVESGMGKCCTWCGCDDIQWEVDEEDECHDEVYTWYNCIKMSYDEDNLPYKLKPEVAELFLFIKSLKL